MSTNIRWNSPSIPPITLHIIIINAILWVATMLLGSRGIVDLTSYLGLHFWKGSDFHFYQLFTYMFMHDTSSFNSGIMHIFFNMFSLWMFGSLLEKVMGMKRYILFYLVCGIGAGLVQELVWQLSYSSMLVSNDGGQTSFTIQSIINEGVPISVLDGVFNSLITVGASGAVFGILLAFGMLFPNARLFIMFIPVPVKAKWAVLGYGLIELFFGVSGTMDNVAHFAHLGGMLFGFILLFIWKKKGLFDKHYVFS